MSIKLTGATSGSIELDVPATVSGGDISLTLPNGVGTADQILKNGSTPGTLEFSALSHGNMPTGSILQVKQTHVNTADSQSLAAQTYTEVSNLSVTITPVSSTSNMLLFIRWCGEVSSGTHQLNFGIRRDSTNIGLPAAAGNKQLILAPTQISYHANNDSTIDSCFFQFLDTGRPSGTSAITYKAIAQHTSAITLYNQRVVSANDSFEYERGTSTIVVMEVAA